MKQTGIHILDFNDKIIDYISRDDGALLNAVMSINADEKSETFDFTVLNERADNLRERNRIIAQDSNGLYREFIITHVVDNFDGTTEIESNASYLEDIGSSKPIKPGKYSAYSTTQALNETLRNTGWELSDDTEHGGMRTTSWTSYVTPYELINQLCTTYSMVADYYIELSSHTVEHRYVSLKKPVSLFKGKEITKGKDLTGMTRTVDMSEVRTALYAVGPEKEKGERLEKIVTDDDAQMQFGLPGRYLWSVYEPESDDENMTLERLTTLAKTELNKRNKSAISYEISSTDIHKFYKDIIISLHDTVRVKDRDFRPPLYLDAEVIAIDYDLLNDESTYKFGNVVEYEESKLRDAFNKRFDAINKKLNDSFTNINTIVNDRIAGELEYYERKIIKSTTPPDNPVEDMLWYDTSNPNVAVLKRYHNGEWRNETAKNVEQLGGMTREQVFYNSLTNTFQNLNIQHSKLLEEVYQLLNSEYLVDNDIRNAVNNAVNNTTNIYDQIKSNLDTMTGDTATIGKLVDTQALFLKYSERLQDLYKAMRNAQVAVEDRLALLQSQYTDEKFNDAMNEVAKTLPNGRWDSENQQLYADIPNKEELSNLKQTLQDYYDGNIKELEGRLNNSVDSKMKVAKDEISANVKSVENKVDGVQTRVNTTESNISALKGQISLMAKSDDVSQKLRDVDGRLTPLETTVKSNKATLDLLPDQINSKVSKQDYTTNQNNLVTRLNNADSERKQLATSISDKVSLKEYENGLDLVKSTNRNYLQSYYSTTQNSIGGITKTPYYVELNAFQRINFYFYDRSNGGNPSLKQDTDYILKIHESSPDIKIGVFYKRGSYTIVGYTTDKVIRFNTGNREDILIVAISQSNEQYIGKISLYEGTKELDWSPAPEDIELLGLTAETNAKAYTDAQKEDTDVKLTKMDTDISQNGEDIQLRATKEEFNATNKTLSKTVADFTTNVATGMTFTYNENGTIQAMNIGNDGIKLRGDKVDITVNKEFNVVANKVDNKVGKDEIINRLNLSPEGLDIDVNKVGIRGGDGTNYIKIQNSGFLSYGQFKRSWSGEVDTANLELGISNGRVLIRNQNTGYRLYLTERGLSTMMDGFSEDTSGTLEFHSTRFNDTSRGITMHSTYGAVAMLSEQSRAIVRSNLTANIESYSYGVYIRPYVNTRPGINEFNFYVKSNDNAGDTDGAILFGEVSDDRGLAGSGIRFKKRGLRGETSGEYEPMVYATDNQGSAGTGSFYARKFYGDFQSRSGYLYLMANDRVRITDYKGYNNGSPNYADLQCQHIQANTIRTNVGRDFYIGVSDNELRVTNNLFWNGGNVGYKDVHCKDVISEGTVYYTKGFSKKSSEQYKENIKKWNFNATNSIKNTELYQFNYIDDENKTLQHGVVIERETPQHFVSERGDSVNSDEILYTTMKALKEQIERNDELEKRIEKLEEQLNEQSITS
ncbi:phage tail spike protein [Staphylococcus borealis]